MKKLCLFLCFCALCQAIWAQQKYALVIGNGNYTALGKLKNPVNDAEDVAAALNDLGFNVDKVLDGDLDRMENAILRLKSRLTVSKNAYGFLFYAGHGVQSNGVNYLIPVGVNIPSENFLRTRALSVQVILDELNDASNELNVVVLDACRDNPFSWARTGSRGLTVIGNQPADSIVVYATSAGSTAQDGTGRNGLFTSHLLNNLKTPGLEVTEIFRRTGVDVIQASGRKQIPALYSQFFGNAYFSNPAQPTVTSAVISPITPPVTAAQVPPPELPKAATVSSPPPKTSETITVSSNQKVETPELVITPSKPSPVYTFTSISAFKKWLSSQPDNTLANPYNVKLNVNNLTGIKSVLKNASLKYVNLDISGTKITTILYSTFNSCTSLTNIIIGNSVTKIGQSAFAHCTSLESVTIPNSVTIIGIYSFENCNRLSSITIPNSVIIVDSHSFVGCSSLIKINIPNSVKNIGLDAFKNCKSLTSVIIGNNVASIGSSAFEGCIGLTSITIPNSVTSIGDSAFSYCTSLASVTFQGTIPSNEFSTSTFPGYLRISFYATDKIKGTPGTYTRASGGIIWTLQSPETTETLTASSNQSLESLKSAITPSKPSPVYTFTSISDFKKWLSSQPDNTPVNPYIVKLNVNNLTGIKSVLKSAPFKYVNLDISETKITTILYSTFDSCTSLTNIIIGNSVTKIEQSAFAHCVNLVSAAIPDSVTIIGKYSFEECSSLKKINIPNSVKNIGSDAFINCEYLTSVTIGNNVIKIEGNAFEGCISLTSVTFKGTIPSNGFSTSTFPGYLRNSFYATDKTNGTPGTYTRDIDREIWTLQYSNNTVGMYRNKITAVSKFFS